ncbi:MAG: hypothetical protein ACLP01_04640 [Solirubrobacteraceae bacterium]
MHSTKHKSLLLTVVACLIGAQMALVAPGVSLAAAPPNPLPSGVHVDPGSPAAKQYAIPLNTARGTPPGSSGSGSTFGQGISHNPASDKSSGTRSTPTSAATPTGGASGSGTPAPGTSGNPTPSSAATGTAHRSSATRSGAHPGSGHPAGSRHGAGTGRAGVVATTTAQSTPTRGSLTRTAAPPAEKVLHSGSGSGLIWMLAPAALVLVLGAAGALLSTGRRRSAPSAG